MKPIVDATPFPDSYDAASTEQRWQQTWEQEEVYRWEPTADRNDSFVIDTPPPTASGSLHVGHIFSYTQTDILARYKRMQGKQVFYPIGWDDNGLPTERRVQNFFRIGCNPQLPFDPQLKFDPTHPSDDGPLKPVSRRNFVEACSALTTEDEKSYKQLFKRQGISFDWRFEYATIDAHCRRISQVSFLDLIQKKYAYQRYAPTMWDVDFRSAVAQAEIEDREIDGLFHSIRFDVEGGGDFTIATTRPELLAACIAVVAHPEDERYQHLFGKRAITPLFSAPVPIIASEVAEKDKGTGIMMICTFGDLTDVQVWMQHRLPLRQIIGYDGRISEVVFGESGDFVSTNPAQAQSMFAQLRGTKVEECRRIVVQQLKEAGRTTEEPKKTRHAVKFYEKGSKPLEIIPSRQWFVKLLDFKEQLVAQGRKIAWHPDHMRMRYEHWVNGLNQDWCISRQRFFGVPFPVWYRLQENGTVDWDNPIFAPIEQLPVDPASDVPPGYREDQRGKAGGFMADPDVMDTWATSSMTPQIQSHWSQDAQRHSRLFPMDVRPQAHEIIRTWAFYTIVKAWMHEGEVPWRHAAISGFIMDSDRKKMSKSKGNVIVPLALIEEHSADAIRYWAARGRLGIDTIFDTSIFKIGKKLTVKLFNATRFIATHCGSRGWRTQDFSLEDIKAPLDIAFMHSLKRVVEECGRQFESYEHSLALQGAEQAFWSFCDNYLEIVKNRINSESREDEAGRKSGLAAASIAIRTFLRLFAPVLPHITEELWSRCFAVEKDAHWSIHRQGWPSGAEFSELPAEPDASAYELAVDILADVRKSKAQVHRGPHSPVAKLSISCDGSLHTVLRRILPELAGAIVVDPSLVEIKSRETDGAGVQVEATLA